MQIEIDFIIQLFSFSAGVGILLVYAYWHGVRPDRKIRWAMVLLVCVSVNYLLGLYAFFLEQEVTTNLPLYSHFAIQGLTLLGMFLALYRLLLLIGATIRRMELVAAGASLALMVGLNAVAHGLQSSLLQYLSSFFFMAVGLLLFYQFWKLTPEKPLVAQIRTLALIGLGLLLPAFILQSLLPDSWLKFHPADALAYLYVMGSALWIALNGLFKHGSQPVTSAPNAGVVDMDVAQQQFDLTEREYEVLQFLVQAKPYKTIAHELSISLHTVKSHASNIYRKTGAKSKSDLKYRFRLNRT
ncbi:MAG: helix-turn-helix transcriptional regulator [Natronospirillum sp.]